MYEEEKVLKIIDSKAEELASLLQKLIQFDSVNPPGNEGPIARYLGELLRDLGFKVEIIEVEKDRPNVIGRSEGTEGKPSLLCYAHTDVVPPGDLSNWKYPPFDGVRVDDKIYGRGSQDHKFPIPPFIIAFEAIREAGLKLKGDLVFTFVADEESGGKYGFNYLVDNGYYDDTDCMIYGGPGWGGDAILIAANGQMLIEVTVMGKAAHTMNLEAGVNAIIKANKVINRFQELAKEVNCRTHPLTKYARMSINIINAGVKFNVLPDKCLITIDRRITPSENLEDAKKEIQNVVDELKHEDPELKIKLNIKLSNPPVTSDPESKLVQIMRSAADEIRGEPTGIGGLPASVDFSWYVNKLKKPSFQYCISNTEFLCHAPNEHTRIPDLVANAKLYALCMIRYLGIELD